MILNVGEMELREVSVNNVPFSLHPVTAAWDKNKIKEHLVFYFEKIIIVIPPILDNNLVFNTFLNMLVISFMLNIIWYDVSKFTNPEKLFSSFYQGQ